MLAVRSLRQPFTPRLSKEEETLHCTDHYKVDDQRFVSFVWCEEGQCRRESDQGR